LFTQLPHFLGWDGYRGAPRLVSATFMHLAELSQLAQSAEVGPYVPGTVSLSSSSGCVLRRMCISDGARTAQMD